MGLFDGLFDDETLFRGPEAHPLPRRSPTIESCEARTEASWPLGGTGFSAHSAQPANSHGCQPASQRDPDRRRWRTARTRRTSLPGVDIVAVEPALRDLDDLAGSAARVISAAAQLGPEIDVFVGLPYAPGWEAAVELIEAAGLYGKIDTGGADSSTARAAVDLGRSRSAIQDHQSHPVDWLTMLRAIDALIDGASPDDAAELMGPRS